MSTAQNAATWGRYRAAVHEQWCTCGGAAAVVTNRGFRMRGGRMMTYEQQKLGLSAYYDKWHTEPVEYHILLTEGAP